MTSFTDQIDELFKAVAIRHDIVHRNGKDIRDNAVVVTMGNYVDWRNW